MLSLFRAEWQKIIGHRWVVGMLIWIFPAGAAGVVAIFLLVALFASPEIQQNFGLSADASLQWTTSMITAWSLPNQMFGRFIIVAFSAVMFAGEYQWGTWKNVIPRSTRVHVIIIKFVALGTFVLVSFAVTSLIAGIGMDLPVVIAGAEYGPPIGEALENGFLLDILTQAAVTFISALIAANYAALAAMITSSILGSIMVGVGIVVLEMMSLGLFGLLSTLFNNQQIMALFRWTPTYNISNIVTTLNHEEPLYRFLTDLNAHNSVGMSLLVLAVWVFGLMALTAGLFQRRDVTT
jgi:ABC-type transport system involved in multi-copper enzyme maturation permease subunit